MTAHPKAEILREIADEASRNERYWEAFEVRRYEIWETPNERLLINFMEGKCAEGQIRRKPRTVRIGDYDVPLPVREPLEVGQEYYVARPDVPDYYFRAPWDGDARDYKRLERGLIHLEADAAQAHGKALASLMRRSEG